MDNPKVIVKETGKYGKEPMKVNVLREIFGTAKSKKSVKQMMKEMDKELYDI